MTNEQRSGFGGRTRSALADVIEGLTHSIIDNLYVRFEVENQRIPSRVKPNKLKKAIRLVEVASRPGQLPGTDVYELVRYIVEDVHGGDLNKDWQPLGALADALASDGYQITDGRLTTAAATAKCGIAALPSSKISYDRTKEPSVAVTPDRRTVFLVHGRDNFARNSLTKLLRALDLKVINWREAASMAGGGTPYTGDIVRAGMEMAHAVVVLFTPDDVGYVRPALGDPYDGRDELERTGQARLNVVFEAGMAMALDRTRVVLVEVGRVRQMSDTAGLNVIRLHDDIDRRKDLAARLKAAGLAVDETGEEWRTAGTFDSRTLSSEDLAPTVTSATTAPSKAVGVTETERLVLTHLNNHFSQPGQHRLNTPFQIAAMEWPQVAAVLRDLADASPPYIEGVSVNEADYPVVITGLTDRGRVAAR